MFVPLPTSDRLQFRLFQEADLPFLASMFADERVMQFFIGGTRDLVQTRRWLAKRQDQWNRFGRTLYALEKKEGGLVGYCGFIRWEIDGVAETEIAYGLAREAWGRGYAVEAAVACRDFAFARWTLARLIALIHPENTASSKVARRIGMVLDRRCRVKGVSVDLYAIDCAGRPEGGTE
ncbi:GNAT family N-acetyltransferase [Acanthopleuribacter pedis]|uniref:GNAT family N-acetyltransferase n=1 Tax=Acanthopleuribacter pedis TaxID=442870 RepID=A0A8J7QI70_9BACT|nr:GNAT family N-acetyltransferase [Acanthopleuribacter pedis]MBO1318698.1 GNAT family N-acetyltransferase [Acanthopleuribacter pedis]